MTNSPLTNEQLRRFREDGFVALSVFDGDEVAEIRDTFMEMARNGPVEGLSEIRRRQVDGKIRGYDVGDPLSRYPRMMQPHKHMDKPVAVNAIKALDNPAGRKA